MSGKVSEGICLEWSGFKWDAFEEDGELVMIDGWRQGR